MRRVGIDLALQAAHKAAVYEDGEPLGRPFPVERTRAGVDELVRRATAGLEDGSACEFAMEPTGLSWLPLAAELDRRGHRSYLPKPQKTHALRKFLARFTKTDGMDARAAALVRHVDRDNTFALRVPRAEETTLRLSVKQRARIMVELVRCKDRIHSWLVLANPHLGKALGRDAFSEVATAFLRRHLDPFEVRERGKAWLARFWRQQSSGRVSERQLEAVWAACETSCELYEALRAEGKLPFEYEALGQLVAQELEHIEFLERQVDWLDAMIARTYHALDPERLLEREVPGVGATIGAAVEAFAGDVSRFSSSKRFAAYFGLVPRTKQTGIAGEKPRQALTKGGQNLLKQYMFLAAESARRHDPELAATYESAIARGKHHYSAVIIVAHKLVRRIYALLKQRHAQRVAANADAPVSYRLRSLDDGAPLTHAQARDYVKARFPSKSARAAAAAAAKRAARPALQTGSMPQTTGSSEDATNGDAGAPPTTSVAVWETCGKPVAQAVNNDSTGQAIFSLDRT
jgi:transposase